MKHELDKEEFQEKAALYALGALSQLEARAFERHLAEGCSSCEADLVEFEEVTGTLSFDSPAVTPPTYLRDALLARIDDEVRTAGFLNQSPKLARPGQLRSRVVRTSSSEQAAPSRSTFGTVILPWAAAASLAIAVGALLFALSRTGRDVDNLRAQLDDTNIRLSKVAGDLARERVKLEQVVQVNEVLTDRAHREILLAGQSPAPSSSGTVYWNVQKNFWVLMADLPPPPKGKVYQLWVVTNKNETISAGLITTDESGRGFRATRVPADIEIAAAAITLEPEGGSQQPTMPIYTMGAAG